MATIPRKKGVIKKFLPQTLFLRSLLILIIPVFLIQIISTFVFFDRHWGKVTSRLSYAVAGELKTFIDFYDSGMSDEIKQKAINAYEQNLGILVSFDEGEIMDKQASSPFNIGWAVMIETTLRKELDILIEKPYSIDIDFSEKWVEIRVQMSDGILNFALPQRRLFSSTTYIFLLWVFAASIIILIIAVLFMRNQIRPIRRLAVSAERFGKGRDVPYFKIEGAREVRQAGKAFLDMKTRIQRQISQRTDMLAGVSHDLRTPLTRLKLQVAMLGDSPDIYEMKKDIVDMERMIEGYLNFVRGEGHEKSTSTDIVGLLENVTMAIKRQGTDVSFVNERDKPFYMMIRPVALKRCLMNILSNASKFADFIWITLNINDDKSIEITVEDNGPGISAEDKENVFRPFYRVEDSRNPETGGIGLGLPIAMDIIHAHGGEIMLGDSRHGGLLVHIILPI